VRVISTTAERRTHGQKEACPERARHKDEPAARCPQQPYCYDERRRGSGGSGVGGGIRTLVAGCDVAVARIKVGCGGNRGGQRGEGGSECQGIKGGCIWGGYWPG
jgi:hypothetical protein